MAGKSIFNSQSHLLCQIFLGTLQNYYFTHVAGCALSAGVPPPRPPQLLGGPTPFILTPTYHHAAPATAACVTHCQSQKKNKEPLGVWLHPLLRRSEFQVVRGHVVIVVFYRVVVRGAVALWCQQREQQSQCDGTMQYNIYNIIIRLRSTSIENCEPKSSCGGFVDWCVGLSSGSYSNQQLRNTTRATQILQNEKYHHHGC